MQPTRSEQIAAWVVAAVILGAIAVVSLVPARMDTAMSGVVDAGVRRPPSALCALGPESEGDAASLARRC